MVLPALAMFFLILESRRAMGFAAQGIELCIRTVIPSLFPFFLISIYLTGNLSGERLIPVLVSGFLGGYPVGAQTAAESFRSGRISRDRANRLLMFCSQAGPAFLFGIVAAQFPESKYGWLLWTIQLFSALSVAFLVYTQDKTAAARDTASPFSLSRAMGSAIGAMASVCGWVVIFRVILGFLAFLPLAQSWSVLLSGLLELSNGCLCLGMVENLPHRFLLAAVMLNSGGLCVLLQTGSVIGELDLRYYLLGKLLQTGFAILYTAVFFGYWGALIPIFAVFLLKLRSKRPKNSSIPVRLGV